MAKAIKKANSAKGKAAKGKTAKARFSRRSLVALVDGVATPATVHVDFTSGIGQITAVLFRNGVLINMQSISTDGDIHFSEVQSRDSISINGVCTGDAVITISMPTNPSTPDTFSKEIIIAGYIIQ